MKVSGWPYLQLLGLPEMRGPWPPEVARPGFERGSAGL